MLRVHRVWMDGWEGGLVVHIHQANTIQYTSTTTQLICWSSEVCTAYYAGYMARQLHFGANCVRSKMRLPFNP